MAKLLTDAEVFGMPVQSDEQILGTSPKKPSFLESVMANTTGEPTSGFNPITAIPSAIARQLAPVVSRFARQPAPELSSLMRTGRVSSQQAKNLPGYIAGGAGTIADTITGIVPGLIGIGTYPTLYGVGRAAGMTDKQAAQEAARDQHLGYPEVLAAPASVLARKLGPKAEEYYQGNYPAQLLNWLGKGIEKGSEKLEDITGSASEHPQWAANSIMSLLGAKALAPAVRGSIRSVTDRLDARRAAEAEAAQRARGEPSINEVPLEQGQVPYRSEVPVAPDAAVAESQRRIREKELKQTFGPKATPELEALQQQAAARALRGDAMWRSGDVDYPVKITGEPIIGPDGKMYSPAMYEGTPSYVPTLELTAFSPVADYSLLPKQPPAPPSFVGTRVGVEPKTSLGVEPPIIGETPSSLVSALDKVRKGELATLTAEEKIQLRGVTQRGEADFAAKGGIQRGSVDPRLLGAIAGGTALAYGASQDPELTGQLGVLGALTMGGVKSKRLANEPALIEAARNGDQKAFTTLYTRLAPQLERTLSRYTRDPALAQDLVQETFASAFSPKSLENFKGDAAFSTYLHSIALNKAKNVFRSNESRIKETELTPELSEIVEGTARSPEQLRQDTQLQDQLATALDKVPEDFRRPFEMRELEGKSYEEIAAELNIPINTVRSRIFRAKESLQSTLKKQGGSADPKLLAGIAAAGGLAAYLAANPDKAEEVALLGAAGTLGVRGQIFKGLDKALGASSTRLGNIDPALLRAARDNELILNQRIEQAQTRVAPFILEAKKLPADVQQRLERAYLGGNDSSIASIIRGNPKLVEGYREVRNFLNETQEQLLGLGRFKQGLTNYLPRVVKDYEGLRNALGLETSKGLEKVMQKAEAAMATRSGRALSDVERSVIVDNWLKKELPTSFMPGYAKRRSVEMTDELQPFYYSMGESLAKYASASATDIQMAKFFGKDLRTTKEGSRSFTNVEDSIGALVDRAMREKRMTPEQAVEVSDVLRARFGGGEEAPAGFLQDIRNISNIGLLGQLGSGVVQVADTLAVSYHHGIVPALQAVGTILTGRGVKPSEFGLSNHVIEEIAGKRMSGRALSAVLKLNTLSAIDQFGKRANLTAGFIKNKALATTEKGRAKLEEKWGPSYGEELPQLIQDLQRSKPDARTPLVDSLLWQEISNAQPISRLEMTETYNKHPNGRLLYQLKQYMLKQGDVIRRDSYNEIKTGDPAKIAKGLKNLTLFGTTLALASVPGDAIKEWISGRDFDLDKIDYVENLAKNFGLNRYAVEKVLESKKPGKAVIEAAEAMVKPPALSVVEKLGEGMTEPRKLVPMIPVAGRAVYDRFLGGNEDRALQEYKKERIRLRNEREADDPSLKEARLERVRKYKERQLERMRNQ